MSKTQEALRVERALKLALEFNRYFTSANSVDVPERISVPRDEWREVYEAFREALAEQPAQQQVVKHGEALYEAVSAIYFTDSSDYLPALRSVVRCLAPDIVALLESNPNAAWHQAEARKYDILNAAPQPAQQQEPVEEFAYKAITKRGEHFHFRTHAAARIWAGEGGKVETIKLRHLELVEQPAPVAEPHEQQEPVAWMHIQGRHKELSHCPLDDGEISRGWEQYPLYASPPNVPTAWASQRSEKPWAGLTDEDVWNSDELMKLNAVMMLPMDYFMRVVRAIEAKLREKNEPREKST